jgi:hypothetical protein
MPAHKRNRSAEEIRLAHEMSAARSHARRYDSEALADKARQLEADYLVARILSDVQSAASNVSVAPSAEYVELLRAELDRLSDGAQ